MPNIRHSAPGTSRSNDEDDEEDYQPVYRGGGKQFPGGKGFRPPQNDDLDDDDSDESESEDEAPPQQYSVVNRGSGKQFGGGKYLRPSHDADDDDEDDEGNDDDEEMADDSAESDSEDEDEEEQGQHQVQQVQEPETVRVMPRSGGKSFQRPAVPDDDEDSDDDDDDEEEEEEKEAEVTETKQAEPETIRVMPRSGGKSFQRPAVPDDDEDEDSDEDDDEDEVEEVPAPLQTKQVAGRSGGKSFNRMVPSHPESEESDDSEDELDDEEDEAAKRDEVRTVYQSGKQLRKPESKEGSIPSVESLPSEPVASVRPSGGGKQLRPPEPVKEPSKSTIDTTSVAKQLSAKPAPAGGKQFSGKQLRMREMDDDKDEEDDQDDESDDIEEDDDDKEEAPPSTRPAAGGKQLRMPEHEKVQPSTASETPARGKQLRRLEAEKTQPFVPATTSISQPRGKQLRRPEPGDIETESPKPTKNSISQPRADGGKQLRRPTKVADDDEEEDDNVEEKVDEEDEYEAKEDVMDDDDDDGDEVGDDDDDDDDDDDEDFGKSKTKSKSKSKYKQKAKPQPKAKAKPKTKSTKRDKKDQKERKEKKEPAKKKIVDEPEEIFGDDDVSSDEEAELDVNNSEALIKDEADRKYLDSLPELDREAILAERFEKLKAEQDMKRAIREAKRKEDETKPKMKEEKTKEKSYTEGDEELAKSLAGRRSSARERDATGAKSKKAAALAALKKERKIQHDESSGDSEMDFGDDDEDSDDDYDEDGAARPWAKKTKAAVTGKSTVSRLDKSDESGEDMDIDEDEDDQPNTKESRKTKEALDHDKDALMARHEDFVKVTIPRRRLERWCNEPFFQAAVLECFVRILIGEDDSGEKVYRLCEIVDVKISNKSFKFPVVDKNSKPVSTNKLLRLKFGTSERDFPMYLVSDAPPTEADVQKYITAQKNNRLEVLSKRRANKLRRLQDELVSNYIYTTEDIEKNLQRRKKQGKSSANLGIEATRIAIAVKGARDAVADAEQKLVDAKKALMESSGNPAEESELENKVHDCTDAVKLAKKVLEERLEEEKQLLAAVEERNRKLSRRSKDLNWAKVNERALKLNQQTDREGYKALKEAEVSVFPGKKDEFNPYARRRVKPKVLWTVSKGAAVEDDDTKGEEKKESKEEIGKVDQPVAVGTPSLLQETLKAVALSESHQFAIDEEGLAQSSGLGSLGVGGGRMRRNRKRVRTGLSLAQYLDLKERGET